MSSSSTDSHADLTFPTVGLLSPELNTDGLVELISRRLAYRMCVAELSTDSRVDLISRLVLTGCALVN